MDAKRIHMDAISWLGIAIGFLGSLVIPGIAALVKVGQRVAILEVKQSSHDTVLAELLVEMKKFNERWHDDIGQIKVTLAKLEGDINHAK